MSDVLNIGFDAKRAFQNFTGLGNYSRTLLETLCYFDSGLHLHLFAPKDTHTSRMETIRAESRVTIHTPQGFGKLSRAWWRSAGVVSDVKHTGVEIFHGLSHELPSGLSSAGIRSVVTMHDLIHERYPSFYPLIDRKVYSYKFQKAAKAADIVVAISEQTKEDLIGYYGVPKEKIQVVYQSCHPQFSVQTSAEHRRAVIQKYALPERFILYVGTVNERKNLLGLVQALQQVNEIDPDLHLVVCGHGKRYEQKVRAWLSRNKVTETRVKWLPQQDFTDMPAVYQSACALVLPSFFEGFGIPIIEALSGGVPVITSKGGCFPEAGGPHSCYVNPHDSSDIATAILKVANDEVLRQRMATHGLAYVQKFSPEVLARQWGRLYRSLIS